MTLLVDVVARSTVLLAAAFALASLMRRASAASRHLVWCGAFAALIGLPLARVSLPALPVPVLEGSGRSTSAEAQPLAAVDASGGRLPAGQPMDGKPDLGASAGPFTGNVAFLMLWIAGGGLIVLRRVIGALRVRAWVQQARTCDDARVCSRMQELAARVGVRRPVALLMTPATVAPAAVGALFPKVLLPPVALTWIERHPRRLDAVLAHELAHVARHDAVWQVVGGLALAVAWFNPLMWVAVRQARLERERASDDAVLRCGMPASAYAGELLALVRSCSASGLAAAASLSMASCSLLPRRVRAILDPHAGRGGVSRMSASAAAIIVLGALPLSAARLTARPGHPTLRPVVLRSTDAAPPAAERPSGAAVEANSKRPIPLREQSTQLGTHPETPSACGTTTPAADAPGNREAQESGTSAFGAGAVPPSTPGLVLPNLVQFVAPRYTVGALRAKLRGAVCVDVVVRADGTVGEARLAKALPSVSLRDASGGTEGLDQEIRELDAAALDAVRRWRFEPGVLNGRAVPVLMTEALWFVIH